LQAFVSRDSDPADDGEHDSGDRADNQRRDILMLARRLRNVTKGLMRRAFEQGQRLGIDVLPRHFYSELPNIHELRRSTHWKAPFSMTGVDGIDIDSQLRFIAECCPPPMVEELRAKDVHRAAVRRNEAAGYGPVEAEFLYAFVCAKKPRQIFQIGCGVSTAVCLLAAERAGYRPQIICVEPYPTGFLIDEAAKGSITLLQKKIEQLEAGTIDGLGNDVLFFVDSTHTLGPAGEVSRIILELMPRLKPGAHVHFHDITFPYDYAREILSSSLFFAHESVLLHAFLAYNHRFRVLASLSYLHYLRPTVLQDYLRNYQPQENDEGLNKGGRHFPSSTYLAVVA
jgi:Methyltransferase domain